MEQKAGPPKSVLDAREARLAAALRDNLKRRKAAPSDPAQPESPAEPKSRPES